MIRRYSAEEKQFLREYIPGHTYHQIMDEFNRRFPEAITLKQIKSFIGNNKLNTGHNGRFKKGSVPPNKGKKVRPETYEKMAPTMFKPGDMPHNTHPIGTELMLADGYIWVKINDIPKARKNVNWIQKHRLIWTLHNGPIPKDHLIIFLDGDRTNFDIDNLACISRSEHVRMNQSGFRSPDPEMTETGIALTRLKAASIEAKKRRKK